VYETEIARGVAALDAEVPTWRAQVDVESLDMRHAMRCVVGQVFGHFWNDEARAFYARHALVTVTHSDVATLRQGTYLGFACTENFNLDEEIFNGNYATLTAEWRRELSRSVA
jgi:hypothetical protein